MNRKKGLAVLALLFCMTGAVAQDWSSPETVSMLQTYVKQVFNVSGKVYGVDEYEPNPYPLQGANVTVTCLGDTTSFDGSAVYEEGDFWIYMSRRDRLRDTRIRLTVSYLGMQTLDSIISPRETREEGVQTFIVELDSIVLHSNPLTTQEVEIVAELQRMYQRGDTVIFNADAYEMPTGSVLLDLVRRLPGLKYSDGKMTYLGRDINEIRLNGDSFFKRDMSIALNNMPSDKLKSLKVYEVPDDTLNEMSKNHLIMDMETKEPMERTIFANIAAGTTENFDRYSISADASSWKQNGGEIWLSYSRSTIPSEYAYHMKEENSNASAYIDREFDKGSVNASISYSDDGSEDKNESLNRLFMPQFTQNSHSINTSSNTNGNWNASAGANYRVNSKNWINMNLGMRRGWNSGYSNSLDSISNEGEGLMSTTSQSSVSSGDNTSYNFNAGYGGNIKDYHFNMNFAMNRDNSNSLSTNTTTSQYKQLGDSVRYVNHRITSPSENESYNASLNIYRSIGENGNISIGYDFSYNGNTSMQNYDDVAPDGSLSTVDSLHYDRRNSTLNHAVDMSYYYNDSLYRFNVNAALTPVRMSIDNIQTGKEEHLKQSGLQFHANADFRVKVFRNSQIGLGYNASNNIPDVSQLSTVTDYSDPMNIRLGNSSLKNSISQNASLEYQFRSWMRTRVSYGTTLNQITQLTRIDRTTGARTTMPTNINGNWNVNEYLFLTYPFRDLSVNFTANHSLRHNVAYVQSYLDAAATKSSTDWSNLSLVLEGAYSDRFWIIRASAGYSVDDSKSNYMQQSNGGQKVTANGELSYTSSFGLGASTNCSYTHPFGYQMEAANKAECLWNISAEYSFLESRQATLSFTWRDILKSYNGFTASASGSSWNENRNFGDTSMFVIMFRYRFNQFR